VAVGLDIINVSDRCSKAIEPSTQSFHELIIEYLLIRVGIYSAAKGRFSIFGPLKPVPNHRFGQTTHRPPLRSVDRQIVSFALFRA
jgi:hypothetical protein